MSNGDLTHTPASTDEPAGAPRRWLALAILLAAGFMDLLDTTIVNVAIPAIRGSLHSNYAGIQWIVAGYLLAVAVGLITGGRLGDIAGRRRVFVIGVVAFGLTSLGSGLAVSPAMLIATRVLQGMSAAIMIPQILSIIQVNFPRSEQSKALALYSSVAGVAVMSGPLMAGVLLNVVGLGWRSIFLINVPVSVLVTISALRVVPESKAPDAPKLDLGGVVLVSTALLALLFGIIQGRELGWPAWVFALMAAAIPIFGLFAVYERRKERRRESPLVPPSLFRERAFSSGLVVVIVFFSGLVGFFLAFTIFLQLGLGYTPLDSALTTFPSSIGLVVASQISAKLAPRLGRKLLMGGAVIMALAQGGLIFTVHHYGPGVSQWNIRPVIFVFGLGMGLILPSLADVIIAGVHQRNAGAASGIINTGMQVGNAIGVAIIGVILFAAIGSHAARSAASVEPQISKQLDALQAPPALRAQVLSGFRRCFVDRSHQEDPAVVPASCRELASAQLPPATQRELRAVLATAGVKARKANFVTAIQRALSYEVAVFAATFLLLFLLPAGSEKRIEATVEVPGAGDRVAEGVAS
jgi:EmrB/QacA subfamily drug resistance transporter